MSSPTAPATRTETDSLGAVEVPADALWGAQTARSLQHFALGEPRMPLAVVHALAQVKRAAAEVNGELGLLEAGLARAVAAAAARVAAGEFDEQFPLSLWQTGSGTQTHMNVNEVVASLASLALGGGLGAARRVHPNDDVNLGQSSNDVFPTAMHVAVALGMAPLWSSLARLRAALRAKALEFSSVIKIGRTHLQDATPVTLGQEFTAYDAQLGLAEAGLRHAEPALWALPVGGTAVGNGVNTHVEFGERVTLALAARLGLPFTVAANRLAATAGHEALVALHGGMRVLAVALVKLGNDLRLMGSGPRAGLGELNLPANEPGSSIMPGKVNPTQVEALVMVCLQVMGNDAVVGMAGSLGQFELNVCKPLIAFDVLDSQRLLAGAMEGLAAHCVEGLTANVEHMARQLERSLSGVTALVPHVGYERAARIAQHAQRLGLSLREAAAQVGDVDGDAFDAWVDARRMLGPG